MGNGYKVRTKLVIAVALGLLTSSLLVTLAFAQSRESRRSDAQVDNDRRDRARDDDSDDRGWPDDRDNDDDGLLPRLRSAVVAGVLGLLRGLPPLDTPSLAEDCDSRSDTVMFSYGQAIGDKVVYQLFAILENRCIDMDTLTMFVEELLPAPRGRTCLASGYVEGMYSAVDEITDKCIAAAR